MFYFKKEISLTKDQNKSFREARDENAIRAPKALLYGMRKTIQYFKTKLLHIHRVKGFRGLREAFFGESEKRDWYRGHYVFDKEEDIMRRFQEGKPLSCFVFEHQPGAVHVAYESPFYQDKANNEFRYLSFDINSAEWTNKIMGVHFSQFTLREGYSIGNKRQTNTCSHALMLPYWKFIGGRRRFEQQFTLVYSDWEVLRNDLDGNKGFATVDYSLFN